MKLLLFSDPHLTLSRRINGRAPLACLEAALSHAAEHHDDADHLIVLGDLTDAGEEDGYRALARALEAAPAPVSLILGNHDERSAFRRVFGPAGGEGAVCGVVEIGGVRCFLLDTLAPGRVSGRLDPAQLDWLEDALAAGDGPGMIFLHHPPMRIGLPAFDAALLDGGERLRMLIARHRDRLLAVFFGHCHMSVSGVVGGVSAFGVRSLVAQSAPVFHAARYSDAPAAPPAYGVALLDGDALAVHSIDLDAAQSGREGEAADGAGRD